MKVVIKHKIISELYTLYTMDQLALMFNILKCVTFKTKLFIVALFSRSKEIDEL